MSCIEMITLFGVDVKLQGEIIAVGAEVRITSNGIKAGVASLVGLSIEISW